MIKYFCTYHNIIGDKPPKDKCIKKTKLRHYKGYYYKKCKYLYELEEKKNETN